MKKDIGKDKKCVKCSHPAHRLSCSVVIRRPIPGTKFDLASACPCGPYHSAKKEGRN